MKAAILHGKERVQIEDIAPPALKPGEVRLRIEAALTCGTDLKVFKRGYHARMIVPPAVFGHELAGVITEVADEPAGHPSHKAGGADLPVGPDARQRVPAAFTDSMHDSGIVEAPHEPAASPPGFGVRRPSGAFAPPTNPQSRPETGTSLPPAVFGAVGGVPGEKWSVGDRAVVANSAPCGVCLHCRAGQENLCEDLLFLNGAYAESIVVPARIARKNLLRLKPQTHFRDAALTEPLACVVQGVEDTNLRPGQNVLVLGTGPIGLMFVALAKNLGCHVAVAGRRAPRLDAARRFGADEVVDIGDGRNLVSRVREATRTQFDAVIEAVGHPGVWEAAVHLVRKGGTVNFFGGCPSGTTITLDTTLIHYSNLTLLASFHHTPRTIRRALAYIEAGVVRGADFVDGECPLTQLPQLFKSMAAGNHAIKTLIRVHE